MGIGMGIMFFLALVDTEHIFLYIFVCLDLSFVFQPVETVLESILAPFVKSVLASLNWVHVIIIMGTGLTTHPKFKIS